MDIKEFLQSNAGEWFTQRTNYDLQGNKTNNSKANISVELISPDHPQIVSLCQQNRLEHNLSLGGLKYSWDNSVDWGKPKQQGNSLLILVADRDNPQTGKLISTSINFKKGNLSGHYTFGEDKALTLIVEAEDIYTEERQWFAGENLRLRTTVTKDNAGKTQTIFYSEIRKIASKQQTSSSDAVVS